MTRLRQCFIDFDRVKGRKRYGRRLYKSEVLEMRIREVRRKRRRGQAKEKA